MPSSYIAAAMPVDAQPSVSSVTAVSPVLVNGSLSTRARKSRMPCMTSSTVPPRGHSPLSMQNCAHARVAVSKPLA